MIILLLFLIAGNNPMQAFLGVVVVACGYPVYVLFIRNKRLLERRTSE
jgi:hypothetical protein